MRRTLIVAALLSLALAAAGLGSGFLPDDYLFLAQLEHRGQAAARGEPVAALPNLYETTDEVALPWWTPADQHIAFCRPLASALLQADHALFGRNPLGYHLHSLLWLLALLGAVALLYRHLPPGWAALAFLLFALDESLAMASVAIANRHALVAVVPALLGLAAYRRWREDGWRPGGWCPGWALALLGFGVGLLGGEMALGVMAYAVAWELLGRREAPPVSRRLAGLAPLAALAAIYLVAYGRLGFGVRGSEDYLDPLRQPLAFLATGLGERVPKLLGQAVWGAFGQAGSDGMQIGLGLAALLVLAAAAFRRAPAADDPEVGVSGAVALRRERIAWFAGGLASLAVMVTAEADQRQLLVPMVGFAVVLASLLRSLWRSFRVDRRWLVAPALLVLGAIHFLLAPFVRYATAAGLGAADQALQQVAAELPPDLAESPRTFVLVNAPDPLVALFPPVVRRFTSGEGWRRWDVLSAAPYTHRLTRTGPATLEIEVVDGRMFATPLERSFGPAGEPLGPGTRKPGRLFAAEVLAASDGGPQRVAFTFPAPLEEAGVVLLLWQEGQLVARALPAVGESFTVEAAPGLVGG